MTSRTRIADLSATADGSTVTLGGFVETVRDQKKVQFVILRDETGSVQLVNPALRAEDEGAADEPERRSVTDSISALTGGSFLTVSGTLKLDERVKLGGLEVKISSLEVTGAAKEEPPIADDSSVDKRMDWRFLDLRRPEAQLIFKGQTTFEHAMRTWWVENGGQPGCHVPSSQAITLIQELEDCLISHGHTAKQIAYDTLAAGKIFGTLVFVGWYLSKVFIVIFSSSIY